MLTFLIFSYHIDMNTRNIASHLISTQQSINHHVDMRIDDLAKKYPQLVDILGKISSAIGKIMP